MRSVGHCARIIPFLIIFGATSGCGGDSPNSDLLLPAAPTPVANVTPVNAPAPTPTAPRVTATVGTDAAGNPEVTLAWQPRTGFPPGDVVEYLVSRHQITTYPETRPGVVIGSLPPTATQYVVNDALAGQTISYNDIIESGEDYILSGDILYPDLTLAYRKQVVPSLPRGVAHIYRVTALIRLPPGYVYDYTEAGVGESEPITIPVP